MSTTTTIAADLDALISAPARTDIQADAHCMAYFNAVIANRTVADLAATVPAGVEISFDSEGPHFGHAVEGGKGYDFEVMHSSEVRLWAGYRVGGRGKIRKDHKLALRAAILAAYRHAMRGADMGAQHDAHVGAWNDHYDTNWQTIDAARFPDRTPCVVAGQAIPETTFCTSIAATPASAPRKPFQRTFHGLRSIALAFALLSTAPAMAATVSHRPDPFQTAKLEMPMSSAELRGRIAAFLRGMHYEGRGEYNCAPKLCDALLKRYHLTWPEVRAAWRTMPDTSFHSAVPSIAANDVGMRAP